MNKLLEALKGIERCCDGNNPDHEQIWHIANDAIKEAESEQCDIHDVSNCGDYAKNRPNGIQNDEWWCPNCNEVVPSHDVTNDERHGIDGCFTKVC